ncbi:hypothetical protein EUZ93_00335 [Wolbachia pipientis]|nr:hypothetical protein [Wolbachia pipientis]
MFLSSQQPLEIEQLITFLQINKNFKYLHLKFCNIDSKGAEALANSESLKILL